MVKFVTVVEINFLVFGVITCVGDDGLKNDYKIEHFLSQIMLDNNIIYVKFPRYAFLKLNKEYVVTDFLFWDEQ